MVSHTRNIYIYIHIKKCLLSILLNGRNVLFVALISCIFKIDLLYQSTITTVTENTSFSNINLIGDILLIRYINHTANCIYRFNF